MASVESPTYPSSFLLEALHALWSLSSVSLARNDSEERGSAAVSAALVGVSPTGSLAGQTHQKVRASEHTRVLGETPNTARETRALPISEIQTRYST